jgi:hypothetical protein
VLEWGNYTAGSLGVEALAVTFRIWEPWGEYPAGFG